MVDGPDGTPLDVGRKTRRIPSRLRQAVLHRDGVCVFPGLRATDAQGTRQPHTHWARGGHTSLGNLEGHCKFHHRLVHEGGWSTEHNADGRVVFRRTDGTILETAPAPVEPSDGRIEAGNSERGVSISCDTCTPNCYGDPLDLDWVVAGLCVRHERPATRRPSSATSPVARARGGGTRHRQQCGEPVRRPARWRRWRRPTRRRTAPSR